MEEKPKTTRTCDVCKKSYEADFVVPYIIFMGFDMSNFDEALASLDVYSKPMSFKICMECMGKLTLIKIVDEFEKK